jgi:hypothetical protein
MTDYSADADNRSRDGLAGFYEDADSEPYVPVDKELKDIVGGVLDGLDEAYTAGIKLEEGNTAQTVKNLLTEFHDDATEALGRVRKPTPPPIPPDAKKKRR